MSASYNLIRFEGVLDISRYPEFRVVFEELPHSVPVLLDLSDATAADSVFLSEMLMARRRHSAPFVVMIAPDGNLARLFAITGLDAKMNVFADLTAAVASLGIGALDQAGPR